MLLGIDFFGFCTPLISLIIPLGPYLFGSENVSSLFAENRLTEALSPEFVIFQVAEKQGRLHTFFTKAIFLQNQWDIIDRLLGYCYVDQFDEVVQVMITKAVDKDCKFFYGHLCHLDEEIEDSLRGP